MPFKANKILTSSEYFLNVYGGAEGKESGNILDYLIENANEIYENLINLEVIFRGRIQTS